MTANRSLIPYRILSAIVYFALIAGAAFVVWNQTESLNPNDKLAMANAFQLIVMAFLGVMLGKTVFRWLRELELTLKGFIFIGIAMTLLSVAGYYFFTFAIDPTIIVDVAKSNIEMISTDRALISQSIPEYALHLQESLSNDCNCLYLFPLLPLSYVLGTGANAFCLSLFFIYYLPTCFLLTLFVMRLFFVVNGRNIGPTGFIVCISMFVLSTPLIWPLLYGYMEIAGVFIISLMLNIAFQWNGSDRDAKRLLAITVLCLLLVLVRWWFVFYVIGFWVSLLFIILIDMALAHKILWKRLDGLFLNIITFVVINTALIALINPEIFSLVLLSSENIPITFSKTKDLWGNLFYVFRDVGVIWFFAACVGVYLAMKQQKIRWVCLQIMSASLVAVICFTSIQDIDHQTQYLLTPTLLILAGILLAYLTPFLTRSRRYIMTAALLGFIGLNFALFYSPNLKDVAYFTEPYTTDLRYYEVPSDERRELEPYMEQHRKIIEKNEENRQKALIDSDKDIADLL